MKSCQNTFPVDATVAGVFRDARNQVLQSPFTRIVVVGGRVVEAFMQQRAASGLGLVVVTHDRVQEEKRATPAPAFSQEEKRATPAPAFSSGKCSTLLEFAQFVIMDRRRKKNELNRSCSKKI